MHLDPQAKDLLVREDFGVDDHWLTAREETDAFKREHHAESTPQAFTGEEPSGKRHAADRVCALEWHVAFERRLMHRPPNPPTGLPAFLQIVPQATHWLFYAMLAVFPILGWMAASGYGVAPALFGAVPLPAVTARTKELAGTMGSIHGAPAWALLAIVTLHLGGAFCRVALKCDGVVRRTLPACDASRS